MRKKVVAGLLTAMMVLQTPFMALAAEADLTADAITAIEAEATEVSEAPTLVNKADIPYMGMITEEMTEAVENAEAAEAVEAEGEVAAYSADEMDALQAEDSYMIYPADESIDKYTCRGDLMKLYFQIISRGVGTDKWHVELHKGSGGTGDLIASKSDYFSNEESWNLVQLSYNTSQLSAGTYSILFWMEYNSNGTYVTDYSSQFYFDVFVTDTRTPLNSISMPTGAQFPIGAADYLAVTYDPETTTDDTTVTWTNSNPNAVKLTHVNGTQIMAVEAVDYGISYITAQMGDKTAVCVIAVSPDQDSDFPFSDISIIKNNWKYESVKYVYSKGIMNGISGTTWFEPDSQLTRAMFATVLYRMAGSPAVTYTNKFADVPEGKYYSNAIIWANQKGIVKGVGDGTNYGVDQNITREQIAKMLNEYAKVSGYDVSQSKALDEFTDKDTVSTWATGYMQWATGAGLISGKPNGDGTNRLDPQGEATRAECAKMLMMFDQTY